MSLARNIWRGEDVAAPDAGNIERPALEEAGGFKDVAGEEFGIGGVQDFEAAAAKIRQVHKAVGSPSDTKPVTGRQLVGGDIAAVHEIVGTVLGVESFTESLEVLMPGITCQEVERREPRSRSAWDIAPQALEGGCPETLSKGKFNGGGKPLESCGGPDGSVKCLLNGCKQGLQFGYLCHIKN